jgi:hypothetical protein
MSNDTSQAILLENGNGQKRGDNGDRSQHSEDSVFRCNSLI